MKIKDILKSKQHSFSFEFFPPKSFLNTVEFGINIGQLLKLDPSFISITFGAGGSTKNTSFNLVDYASNNLKFTTAAHYTCVNASKETVQADMEFLLQKKIKNLILLRGDIPQGKNKTEAFNNDFQYASDLIKFVKINYGDNFCIGAGGYPETHPEASNQKTDLENLKKKADHGVDFIITQTFFDNSYFFSFLENTKKIGIDIPIIPGIMPIVNFNQIKKISNLCHAKIPTALSEKINKHQNDQKACYEIGLEYSIKQCKELLNNGIQALHFYTLNKSRATIDVFEQIKKFI